MRVNTSWAFAGNTVYAGCQWAVLVLLVKSLSRTDVGEFAYALAVTAPVFVLANVRLRNLLATGIETPAGFHDYLATRLLTTAGAACASLAIGALAPSSRHTLMMVALVAAARSCDAISDICHGLFQRELDMRSASTGLMLNGIVSVVLVGWSLFFWPSVRVAAAAYAAGSCFALMAWDLPRAVKMAPVPRRARAASHWSTVRGLLVRALPLGLSSAVGTLQSNVPRYVVASMLGPAPLAVFAAVSHIPIFGHLAVNAASQTALPVLARDARSRSSAYQARMWGLAAAGAGFGLLLLGGAAVAGSTLLALIYGAEYAERVDLLMWLMAAAVATFSSVFLGAGTTARGRFGAQLTISTTSLLVVAGSVWPLVSRFGLNGAAGSLLAGSLVELGAYVALTIRDRRRAEPAPLLSGALAGGVQP